MNRSGLGLAIAAVLGGIAALLASTGAVYNPVLLFFSLPFAAGAFLIWLHATGRLAERVQARDARERRRSGPTIEEGRRPGGHRRRRRDATDRSGTGAPSEYPSDFGPADAREILGVDGSAGDAAIRRAYRDRVKEAHPDAPNGSEEAFKRVTDAYEHLAGDRR